MLITCPECGLQASDKAMICPHCGFPLKESAARRTYRKSNKRKKLPNGFGRITELHGRNLRKPFRAMVTVGKTENNIPIGKTLGYYPTYNDAYDALAEYNKNPYDLDNTITVAELYKRWSAEYYKQIKSSGNSKMAWSYCSDVYNMLARDIRARHIKGCMEKGIYKGKTPTANVASNIKTLWNLMLDYAVEYEIVDKNYARSFAMPKEVRTKLESAKKPHIKFSQTEMDTLWNKIDIPYVNIILIQCYTGWRPQELGLIKLKDIDFDNWTIIGGIKTTAGKNRIVPIHSKIRNILQDLYEHAEQIDSEYLINCLEEPDNPDSYKMTYDKYYDRFNGVMSLLNLDSRHRPHDPRMQFASMAKEAGVDPYAVKRIIGHRIDDVTEKIYTDVSIEWLHQEIEKIK